MIKFAYAIVLLDLDHFKNINDQFGHHMGDTVLIAVSQKLGLHLRESDVVGRFGGEEFVIVLPQTDKATALRVAEALRAAGIAFIAVDFPAPFGPTITAISPGSTDSVQSCRISTAP